MRNGFIGLLMMLGAIGPASAQFGMSIGAPGVSIGINVPVYPQLVVVPGYPVYYAPQLNSNYFYYDGMYWVYERDNWYASSWYNGPWSLVGPEAVPLYVLRVPVRYYRQPPIYFRTWRADAPPHWGEHWGNTWEQRRHGWDQWNRRAAPAPAPLPVYQRQYSGNRYPHVEQQQQFHDRNYRYQPHDAVVQQHYQAQRVQSEAMQPPRGRQGAPMQAVPAPARNQPAQVTGSRDAQPQGMRGNGPVHEQPQGTRGKGPDHEQPQGRGTNRDIGGEPRGGEHPGERGR